MTFLTNLEVTEILRIFRLVLEMKTGRVTWVIQVRAFRKAFIANNFALSDTEDNTSWPLNRGGMADLPLFRTLLAFHQKSREPSCWEVIDSFVLLAYASLAALWTLLQRLLACLNFRFRRFILFVQMTKVTAQDFTTRFNYTIKKIIHHQEHAKNEK